MKRMLKISAILYVVLLYGFTFSLYSNSLPFSTREFPENSDAERQSDRSFFSIYSLNNYLQSEKLINGANPVPTPTVKDHANDYTIYQKTAELLFFRLFSDYLVYAGNILPGCPKTNIIFPFHNFW